MNTPFVSIIVPVLNEEKNVPRLFASLAKLKYPKNRHEVIIVDGGSTDQTGTISRRFGARVVDNPLRLRGAGCQLGITYAKGELVAFTDADCVVPASWLTGLIVHLTDKKIAAVGGSNITPHDDTDFSKAVGDVMEILTKPGARYGYTGTSVVPIYHNPGCNVMYLKSAIIDVGGFSSSLITCEDEELDYRLIRHGYRILYTPDVIVDHYRRPTYRKIFIQSYRFAIGRAQAIRLHPGMLRWFHVIPLIVLLLCLVGFPAWIVLRNWLVFAPLAVSSVAICIMAGYLSRQNSRLSLYAYIFILFLWGTGWALGFGMGMFGIIRDITHNAN